MQNRQIRKLAIKLRQTHRKNKSWRHTSAECHVLTEDGRTNPGLAKRIAIDKYQPSDDVIARLIRHGAIEGKKKKPQQPQALFDMATSTLRQALIDRKPMPPVDPRIIKQFVKLGWLTKTEARNIQ